MKTGRYGALLSIPGARAPLVLSTAGSLPIGMYGLAILLLARDTTGSFSAAGRVVGAFTLANACGSIVQGRTMDRIGQTRVLRTAASGHLPALIAVVVAAHAGASAWALSAIAACGGITVPQLPASMRSLWNALVDDPEQRATAYALVAVVFEIAVVTAPALVAAIVAVFSPSVAVIVAGAVASVSALAFTATSASRRWRGERHEIGWLGPMTASGMRTVFAVLLAFGAAIGVVQVAVPAFAEARGSAATGGVLLAALSAGSMAGGIVYGSRRWPGALPGRLAALMLGLGGALGLLAVAGTPVVLAMLLVVSGLLVAPTTVVASTLLDTVAPRGTVTEAFAAMVTGIIAGTALGNALGGSLVDATSFEASVGIAGGIAVCGSGLALARRGSLH